ncbi:MAG: DUF4432 family protein [Propionibacteriales bacterium]|nr:DUF4432 family protein [Propionibacteriales bacterium]
MVTTLLNEHLRVDVRPERGAEIAVLGAPNGRNLLASFGGASPLPASRSVSYGSTELDWLSHYRGGWQELFPNAGAECVVNGVPLPFHGEASTADWEVYASSPTSLTVSTPGRLPLVLRREMALDPAGPTLRIRESVTNESNAPMPFLWGHHPAYTAVPGARIDLPAATATAAEQFDTDHNDLRPGASGPWPELPNKAGDATALDVVPTGPRERVVFLSSLTDTWYALRDVEGGVGLAMAWDRAAFPCLWYWTEIGGPSFPWYGRSRIVALEPATAWPSDGLAAAVERGTAHLVDPGATMSAWLTVSLFDADERPVLGVDPDGAVTR